MEHRHSYRASCSLAVSLSSRRNGTVLRGEIIDLSSGGAFIRLHGEECCLGGLFHLGFSLPATQAGECDWPALVIHRRDGGVGVMFDRRRPEAMLVFSGSRFPREQVKLTDSINLSG